MADGFDELLRTALAPAERLPDRRFVATVQARIAVENHLARERRQLLANLLRQLAALGAVAGGLWIVMRSSAVAGAFAEAPALGLVLLFGAFGLLLVLIAGRDTEPEHRSAL